MQYVKHAKHAQNAGIWIHAEWKTYMSSHLFVSRFSHTPADSVLHKIGLGMAFIINVVYDEWHVL